MNDPVMWLNELDKNRPRDCLSLTQDLVDTVGAPPIPPLGRSPDDMIEHFRVIKLISLNADDRYVRAMARSGEVGGPESQDLRAQARFWAHVRDWADSMQ